VSTANGPEPSRSALARELHPEAAPGEAPAKHLRVAPKVSRRVLRQRRRARYAIIGVAAISAASMFLLVTFRVFAAQSSFQLDKLENEQTAAQRENEFLRDQVATRSSATQIEAAATALGMVPPTNAVLLHVSGANAGGAAGANPSQPGATLPKTPYRDLAAGP
jgi:hypothetical protein